jgi:hypothetical protein
MKHKISGEEVDFKPVTVTLTLESQSEVDMVYGVFNYSGLGRTLDRAFGCHLPTLQPDINDNIGINNPCNRLFLALHREMEEE